MNIKDFTCNSYIFENTNFSLCTDFDIDIKFQHSVSNKKFPFHETLLKFLYENTWKKIYLTTKSLENKWFSEEDWDIFLVNIDEFIRFCEKLDQRKDRANAFFRQEVSIDNISISNEHKTTILSKTNEEDLLNIFSWFSKEKRNIFLNLLKTIPDIELPIKNNKDYTDEELLEILKNKDLSFIKTIIKKDHVIEFLNNDNWEEIIENFLKNNITSKDIINIWYRKKQLEVFYKLLNEKWYKDSYKNEIWKDNTKDEIMWQHFFHENNWIFWYWLDYKYLGILQKEAHISDVDLDWTNEVISDFLLWCTNFTVLVEIKKDDTILFNKSISWQNRAKSWKLSSDLMYSVSQILEQKADWQIKAEKTNYNEKWEKIHQKTINPKCFLIIWRLDKLWDTRDDNIKFRTFELFRRNLNNIEIITYDELYNRAKFIIENTKN